MMAASSLLNWSISRNPFSPNLRKESWFLFVITELKTVTTTCWRALAVRSLHSGGGRGSAEFSNHPALPRGLCTNSEGDTDSHRNTGGVALPGPRTHFLTAGPLTSLGKPEASRKPSLKTTCVVEPSYSLKRHLLSTKKN